MDFTLLFIKMLLILVIVCVGAVVFLRYVLPRMSWARKWQKNGHIELVSRFGLDYGRTLYLVRVGKKYLVLGGAEQGVNLITELNRNELE